jgi:hypothetical protein
VNAGNGFVVPSQTNGAVAAVGRDDEIGVAPVVEAGHVALEQQFDPSRACLLLQDAQQRMTAHAAETVTGRRDPLTAIVHLDVVPVHEVARDGLVRLRVGIGDAGHRRVREHDSESERVVGPIAFDDADLMTGIGFLHQHREIQTAGAAADADDSHQRNFTGRFATNA